MGPALGAKTPHHKNTTNMQTVTMPVPGQIVVPMQMHIGAPCECVVKKGDEVHVGTLLGKAGGFVSADIHSGVSGVVKEITQVSFTNGSKCSAVVITTNGEQTLDESVKPFKVENAEQLVKAAQNCGLVGLGGAGFPTAVKFSPKDLSKIDTLVINAAECEPYITADNREILENCANVMLGIEAVKNALNIKNVVIGIERNKPEAIDLLFATTKNNPEYKVHPLKSIYPQGAEKVLIYKTTKREVPRGKLPGDVGVIVMNVTTAGALGDYIKTGMPLVTKRLTIDGSAVNTPQNVKAIIGTSIKDIVDFCGGYKEAPGKIISGGPMMGSAICNDDFPIVKQNNAIIALAEKDAILSEPSPCIRCGRCVDACPMSLSPVEISCAREIQDIAAIDKMMADLCIACGTCSFVCPAKRDVSQSVVLAKLLKLKSDKEGK